MMLPEQRARAPRSRRLAGAAGSAAIAMTALHVAWSFGARWGYSACGWGELTVAEARTGCHAARADVGVADGWLAAGGWLAVALAAAVMAAGRDVRRPVVLTVVAGLLVVSLPLHLLFEIPVGLAGEPTDWRHIATRVVAVVTATLLLVAGRRPPCPHPVVDAPLPIHTRRAIWAAALVPMVCWTGPHLAWLAGTSLGISEDRLEEGRNLPIAAQLAVTFAPTIGAALTLALLTPLARRVPRAVPALGGHRIPPSLPATLAGAVGVLVLAYGLLGLAMMTRDLAGGVVEPADLTTGWAVTLTEVAFVAWGAALLAGAVGFARATNCRACAGPVGRIADRVVPDDPAH